MTSSIIRLDQSPMSTGSRHLAAADVDYSSGVFNDSALSEEVSGRPEPSLHGEFLNILHSAKLRAHFQPIVSGLDKSILGYEALIRGPQGTSLEKPLELFRIARELKLELEFEILCRRVSIQAFAELGLDSLLFLNVSPEALLNPNFRRGRTLRYLRESGIDPSRVVMEITENQQVNRYHDFRQAIEHYRGMGFKIALDDLGSGYSGLRLWTELLPDYIKIDKHFIRHIQQDSIKANFVNALLSMATASRCRVIAEGVEHAAERDMLRRLGVSLMQGYFFARPAAKPVMEIDSLRFHSQGKLSERSLNDSVLRISRTLEPIGPDTRVEQVLSYFQQHPGHNTLPVVDRNQQALGLVDRYRFLNRLMENQFGVALYSRHPISRFLDDSVMQVELDTDLAEVSQQVTALSSMHQAFIVTDDGCYYGVATILDLLEIISEQRLQHARHANPLTLLPGIVPTNEAINRLLKSDRSFHVAYVDLDSFKPYNDAYGYEAGDVVIRRLASLLVDVFGQGEANVGHIGGDDFLVAASGSDFMRRCETLIRLFDREVHQFYRREHLQAKGLKGQDRQGKPTFHPLLSVSLGIVPPESLRRCHSHIDIADLACEAKKLAKQQPGSGYFVNKRSM